jgi:hypothetical protein
MSGQLHALAALPPEKEPLVPVLGNPDHVWYIIIFMLNIEFYDFFYFCYILLVMYYCKRGTIPV